MPSRTSLPALVLNVPAIARQTPEIVQRILGAPDRSGGAVVGQHVKQVYQRGRIEVVFVDGVAKWIKLYDTRALPFDKTALPKLGLPPVRPTYRNGDSVISWHNIPHLQEVSVYAGANGKVTSVLVCVETSPQHRATPRVSGKRWALPFRQSVA